MKKASFLPVSREEMEALGWDECDIIIVSGDAYVDHPSFGAAVIGRYLEYLGYRVGIIPQPDLSSSIDLLSLGIPRLFVGVTSGAMDSMVNHYTSLGRIRSNDAYSQGGRPGRRPDRAVLKYVNRIQRDMPGIPVVIGGIEASLRRVSHYDFWSHKVRRSILLDSKATLLVYGMGERAAGEAARRLSCGEPLSGIRGTAVWMSEKMLEEAGLKDFVQLPSHEEICDSPDQFMRMTKMLERESNPYNGSILVQRSGSRVVVVYPPSLPLSTEELDRIYELPFTRRPHPKYLEEIPAFTMIRNSVTVVRGCSGGCSFCALGLHQGRMISSRSAGSVIREVRKLTGMDYFRGTVSDLGGPTANLYGLGCTGENARRNCRRYSCLYPDICSNFSVDHRFFKELLDAVSEVGGVRNVFVSSGIRYDLALKDRSFIEVLAARYVSGYLKIAPEHFARDVLHYMRKPPPEIWMEFRKLFDEYSRKAGKEQYIEPYILVAFPGCDMNRMKLTASELRRQGMRSEKAQIFLPTPMTMATAMYHTGLSPETGDSIYVAKKPSSRKRQLSCLPGHGRPRE